MPMSYVIIIILSKISTWTTRFWSSMVIWECERSGGPESGQGIPHRGHQYTVSAGKIKSPRSVPSQLTGLAMATPSSTGHLRNTRTNDVARLVTSVSQGHGLCHKIRSGDPDHQRGDYRRCTLLRVAVDAVYGVGDIEQAFFVLAQGHRRPKMPQGFAFLFRMVVILGTPKGNRTPVPAVRGRCPDR